MSGFHGNVGRERPVLYMIQSRPDESGERLGDAFGQLLESVRPELVRFAYWLARDRSVAEDVVQEAMLRAWRARSELKDAAAARHWLLTIVRREHARLYERKRLVTVDVTEIVAREDVALARAGDGELLDLRRAILRLPGRLSRASRHAGARRLFDRRNCEGDEFVDSCRADTAVPRAQSSARNLRADARARLRART